MTEEKLRELQVLLYETGERELRTLAEQLGNEKFKKGLRKQLLEKKLYKLLEALIDERSYILVEVADKQIFKITNRFIADGGWYCSRSGMTEIENEEITMADFPEEVIPGRRLYHLDRDETGFHTQDFEPEEGTIYFFARQTEEQLMEDRKEDLEHLHNAYSIKERIMGGDYQLRDIRYAPIVELICEYFGFEKQPKKVPTK